MASGSRSCRCELGLLATIGGLFLGRAVHSVLPIDNIPGLVNPGGMLAQRHPLPPALAVQGLTAWSLSQPRLWAGQAQPLAVVFSTPWRNHGENKGRNMTPGCSPPGLFSYSKTSFAPAINPSPPGLT